MDQFEYDITRHEAHSFAQTVYFCSDRGDCKLQQIPAEEPQVLIDFLNARGRNGWELIQLKFGRDGVLAFWKRELSIDGAQL